MPTFGSRQEGPQYPCTAHSTLLIFISFETKLCHGLYGQPNEAGPLSLVGEGEAGRDPYGMALV